MRQWWTNGFYKPEQLVAPSFKGEVREPRAEHMPRRACDFLDTRRENTKCERHRSTTQVPRTFVRIDQFYTTDVEREAAFVAKEGIALWPTARAERPLFDDPEADFGREKRQTEARAARRGVFPRRASGPVVSPRRASSSRGPTSPRTQGPSGSRRPSTASAAASRSRGTTGPWSERTTIKNLYARTRSGPQIPPTPARCPARRQGSTPG